MKQVVATGRRKTAKARVYLREGSGGIVINNRPLEEYFTLTEHRSYVTEPLEATETKNVHIYVNVSGGGISGQAGAIRHGIARAIDSRDESHHKLLHDQKMLTRDPRMVERKKYGRRGARRRFQFSKR